MFSSSVFLGSDINRFRASAHDRLEPQRGFYHRWNETFCFKWKRAHGRLFHRSVFSKRNMLQFLCSAVAAQLLAVAM